jgi:hypothetical protein
VGQGDNREDGIRVRSLSAPKRAAAAKLRDLISPAKSRIEQPPVRAPGEAVSRPNHGGGGATGAGGHLQPRSPPLDMLHAALKAAHGGRSMSPPLKKRGGWVLARDPQRGREGPAGNPTPRPISRPAPKTKGPTRQPQPGSTLRHLFEARGERTETARTGTGSGGVARPGTVSGEVARPGTVSGEVARPWTGFGGVGSPIQGGHPKGGTEPAPHPGFLRRERASRSGGGTDGRHPGVACGELRAANQVISGSFTMSRFW